MRVCLANCCFNRPFDEQVQLRIRLETEVNAESADCDWFFTVDDGILKKIDRSGKMRIANPLVSIQETNV